MKLPPSPTRRVLVAYGSESGTARSLAARLAAHPALAAHAPQLRALNDVDPGALGPGDLLLVLSSSFGDGEPPANAERFHETLRSVPSLHGLRYAIFGLGDTGYPRFCGFTRELDTLLGERGAQPILSRVDADAGHEAFFARWLPVLAEVLAGNTAAAEGLHLQVTAYAQDNAFAAEVLECRRLNQGGAGAWHVRLDLRGSGMRYQAGDTLYVLPHNDPLLLQGLADWYGEPEASALLADRELRLLGRPVLRDIARLSGNDGLKALLRTSQKAALDAALQGSDVLDVLQAYASPQTIPLQRLVALLPACLPRAYSIASHGSDDHVELCVREVRYQHRGRERRGAATATLLDAAQVRVYCRSNPGFHLPHDDTAPLLLIGTGTGIAPLRGLLQALHAGPRRETHLMFGEKHRAHDYLYREELEHWQACGTLASLRTAFSRDGMQKHYVQHVMRDDAEGVRSLLRRGAHLYVCGNKAHLDGALREAVDGLCGDGGDAAEVSLSWQGLQAQGRLHCELY